MRTGELIFGECETHANSSSVETPVLSSLWLGLGAGLRLPRCSLSRFSPRALRRSHGCLANSRAPTLGSAVTKKPKDAVARLQDLDPQFTVQTCLTNAETRDNPTYRAQATRAAEGLRRVGVNEGRAAGGICRGDWRPVNVYTFHLCSTTGSAWPNSGLVDLLARLRRFSSKSIASVRWIIAARDSLRSLRALSSKSLRPIE